MLVLNGVIGEHGKSVGIFLYVNFLVFNFCLPQS